ncbi:MGH1-like glycoside hydrolase domain-containing protein [Vitreimonas sp.]|uniref:MGH1-like glycoside hydrolase domain-containing protein n=1 Tax=Vitreimonas sp. TaxID=3069702 RepID=UPI002D79E5B0|nr:trehalase family glycosidase [Vitreimonas sp.]
MQAEPWARRSKRNPMEQTVSPIIYRIRRIAAMLGRLQRLVVFGFEQLVLVRLLERHRPIAESLTAALLKTKHIDCHSPELFVADSSGQRDDWTHGFTAVNAALFLNLRNPDALSPWRHARPAPAFRAIYLWDSAFIAQVWKWWEPQVAWEVLNAVIDGRDGARLQHYVSEFQRSTFTQPPLIAWSLDRLGEIVEPARYADWIAQAYLPLQAYHRWLIAERRLSNGLYAWLHAYESGVENAPRFGDREERRLRDTRTIAAPDLSSYMVLQCEALATMALRLGKRNEAAAYQEEAHRLRDRINEFLWDEREGLYFDRDIATGAFIRSRAITSLLPLWAAAPDQRQAKRLVDHIVNPAAFNTLTPLPSVALDDPAFERDMWRGPVWINTAYAVIEGLRRYGFHAAASDLAFRLCDGVYRTYGHTGRFHEFYDPTAHTIAHLHRKRGNRWKAITLGKSPVTDFVGWTGLVNTLVVETLIGVHVTTRGPAIRPRFPARAEGLRFCLTLPMWKLEIDLHVLHGGVTRGEVRGAFARSFEAEFGATIPLTTTQHASTGAVA